MPPVPAQPADNDVQGISAAGARFAGFCTPKGRLLALLLIWREGDDFLLMLPRDILPPMLKKLSMYVLRSKVKLSDATGGTCLDRLFESCRRVPAPGIDASLPSFGGTTTGRAGDPARRFPLAAGNRGRGGHGAQWQALTATAKPVGLAAWQWLEIAAGQPRVVAATQEAFVPQMLNMELPAVAGVSFSKGCYPGQEIVARTQYLGKVKRRTYRARLRRPWLPAPMSMRPRPASSIAVPSSAWRPPRPAASSAWSACRSARSKPAKFTSWRAGGRLEILPCRTRSTSPAMCLILVAWRVHPDYPLVVAANRDEFFRPPHGTGGLLEGRTAGAGRARPRGGRHLDGHHPRRTLRRPDQFPRPGADAQGCAFARQAGGGLPDR
jgi:folate-binding protein YgfZ